MCDPLLAVSSMLLGGAAAYVILSIAERMRAPDQGPVTVRWLIIGAVAAGLEIWAIHYIGNLAFCPPVAGAQDSLLAVLSLLSAGMTGAVAVYLISSHTGSRMRLVAGGMLMGACMTLTHFSSMMAVHQPIDLQHDLLLFVLSIIGIVGLSIMVLVFGAWNIAYGNWRVTEKASAMGVALSGSHLIGMIPVYRMSGITPTAPPPGIEVDLLAVVAVSLSTLLAIIDRQVTAASSRARESHARMIEAIESIPQWFVTCTTVWSSVTVSIGKSCPEPAPKSNSATPSNRSFAVWRNEVMFPLRSGMWNPGYRSVSTCTTIPRGLTFNTVPAASGSRSMSGGRMTAASWPSPPTLPP
jgi:NO-binding membrane sensor protein with MHYT domain